jgi:hypothetical protein
VTVRPGIFSGIWVTDRPGIFSHIFLALTQTDRHRWPVNNLDDLQICFSDLRADKILLLLL